MIALNKPVERAPRHRQVERAVRKSESVRMIRATLREFRLSICRSLLDSALELQKYQKWLKQNGGDVDRTALMYFGILVDSLGLYYDTGDEVYRQIYIGEAYKTSHDPNLSRDEQQVVRERLSAAIMTGVLDNCRSGLGPGSLDQLVSDLDGMHRAVVIPARKSADVLMVGDCLFLEVASFLCGPLLEEGIEFNPSFIGSHNPAELWNQIRERAQTSWAAVCYSPFTYTFSDHYAASLKQSTGFARPGAVRAMVEPAMEIIGGHLDLIASLFDCPVFVHNSVNVRRHDSTLVDVAKMILSWGTRRRVRDEANRQLADHVQKVNASTFPHVHVFDEYQFLGKHSEWELGRRYYNSRLQHPTVLSQLIADRYRDLIETLLNLSTKKLVVCDLDNTLWEGEIGEGDVRHYQDRQSILRRLREKGVLLAINSRNDARNVHWRGAALDASDFVASEINWDTKPNNMKRIQQKLNLKTKDFVFIDDRGDQREFVSSAFPEMHVLDATADRSWQLLDHWSHLIFRNDEGDRTQQYREREQREQFLTRQADEVDPAKVMANLGLRATLRLAGKVDLRRVVELVNRTNQFNLTGSRTSVRETSEWLAGPGRYILLTDGADKFGQMGIICVAFVELGSAPARIPIFVLSCRVFGYGFETVMLNAIGRLVSKGRADQPWTISGLYQETPLNEPCRAMYPDHGFTWHDGTWIIAGQPRKGDPPWLEIRDSLSA